MLLTCWAPLGIKSHVPTALICPPTGPPTSSNIIQLPFTPANSGELKQTAPSWMSPEPRTELRCNIEKRVIPAQLHTSWVGGACEAPRCKFQRPGGSRWVPRSADLQCEIQGDLSSKLQDMRQVPWFYCAANLPSSSVFSN